MENGKRWAHAGPREFWGELAPCEHVLQIYESEQSFIATLAGFVGDGINKGDCTIVIATREHLSALDTVLKEHGLKVDGLKKEGLYRPLDAKEALSRFMEDNWPDSEKFHTYIGRLFEEAKTAGRKVRAFGEMVALLWAEGNNGATVQLEHLWNEFCSSAELTLFCAYPKSGFTDAPESSLAQICNAHAKIISGGLVSEHMVSYMPSEQF